MRDPNRPEAGPPRQAPPSGGRRPRAGTRFRINRRAAAAVAGVLALAAVGYLVAARLNDRSVRADVLAGARGFERDGKVDLAVRNLDRYLAAHPGDLPTLEELARITAESARGIEEAINAASINDRLLRQDPEGPGRQATRRRLVDLYVRSGDWHRASAIYRLAPESASYELRYRAAEAIARDLIRRGEAAGGAEPGDHRLLAMALEGLAVPGDREALLGSVREYEAALAGAPGDPVTAERLSRLCVDRLNDPARGEKILDGLVAARPDSAEARLIRYRFFLKLHRTDRAPAELDRAIRLAGSDLEVRLTAAGDAIRRGDGAAARGHLAAIPGSRQDDLRVRVMRGMIDFNEERPDEAIDGWRQGLLTIGGTDADLTWWLAHALLQMGRVAEARPLVAQYRRLAGDETQPLYRFLQAELDEKTGRPTRAILALEWARDRIGEFWQAMVQMALGRCYEAIWDQSRALSAYRRANQIDPRLSEPRIAAARLLAAKPDESALEIERGLAQAADDPALRIALVGARLRQQAARPAARRSWVEFDRALDLARRTTPGNSSLLLMQADRMALDSDLPGAVAALERGVARSPRNPALWIALAEGQNRLGRPAEALETLGRAAAPSAAGDRSPVRIARARLLLAQGRGREAGESLVRGLKDLPLSDRPALWEARGRVDATKGDHEAARAAFAEWARLLPDDPRPRLALLELAEAVGDASAVRATVEALRQIGGPEDIAWRLGRAQELLWARTDSDQPLSRRDPRLDEANRLLESVLTDAPEVPAAHLLRGQALERLNRPDDAIASYRRAWDRGAAPALPRLVDLLTRQHRLDELAGLRLKAPAARVDQLSAASSYRAGDLEAAGRFVEQAGQDGEKVAGTRAWQARMLDVIGRPDQSEAALRALAEQSPGAVEPWSALIRSLAGHGKAREAAEAVDRGLSQVKPEARALAEGYFRWASGDREAADRAFRAAIAERPGDVEVRIVASRYYEETGRKPEAAAELEAARGLDPANRGALQQQAVLLASDPRTWDRAAALIGADDRPGDSPQDRLARALVFSVASEPPKRDRAVAFLQSLVGDLPAAHPVASAARARLARLLLDGGQADRAVQVALVPAESATDAASLSLYIECLLRAGKLPEAIRQVERFEAASPADPASAGFRARWVRASAKPGEAPRDLLRAAQELGDGPRAEALGRAAFASILANDPRALDEAEALGRLVAKIRPAASWMVGKVLALRGRPDEALEMARPGVDAPLLEDRRGAAEVATDVATAAGADSARAAAAQSILESVLRRDPADYKVLVMTAMFRHVQARYDDEARLYRAALQAQPGDPLSSNNLAWALSEGLGRPEEALPLLDDVIGRKGRLAWILDTRGVVLTRLGRAEEAIADLKESGGDRPPAATLYHLARACQKANREQEFRRYRDLARGAGISPKELDACERDDLAALMSF